MTTTIVALGILLLVSILVNIRFFNLLKKNEVQIEAIKTKFQFAKNKMKNLRLSGAFESDDEVGWTFDIIDDTINKLNEMLSIEESEEPKNDKRK